MTAVFSDELRARVEADFGRVVDLLSRKIALKSISAEGITAEHMKRSAEFVADELRQVGIDAKVVQSRNPDGTPLPGSLNATAAAIRELGRKALVVPMDLLDSESVLAASQAVFTEYGRVDVLVNNAIYQGSDLNVPFMQLQPETLERVFQGYVMTPFLLTRAVVGKMLEQGGGVVINVSSASARLGSPNEYVDYAASKGALDTFTTAPYFSVLDIDGGIAHARRALAMPAGDGPGEKGFPYVPHVTFGLYGGRFLMSDVVQRLHFAPEPKNIRLTVNRLTLMTYEASVIAGPLTAVCAFDLASQTLRTVAPEAMEALFR